VPSILILWFLNHKIKYADACQPAQKREVIFPILMYKLSTLIGKKNYARAVRIAKKRGIGSMTCAVSNLGNLDKLNTHGKKAQVHEAIATTPHQGLLLTLSTIDGQVNTNFLYQIAEFTCDEIIDISQSFEQNVEKLLKI